MIPTELRFEVTVVAVGAAATVCDTLGILPALKFESPLYVTNIPVAESGLLNGTEQEAVALPLLAVTTTGPQTIAPLAEPFVKVTFPVGGTLDAEAPLGETVALKVTF